MVLPQRMTAAQHDIDRAVIDVPANVASAAATYQRLREIEKEHLAVMSRHNLLAEWSPEVRTVVLTAREKIHQARSAREQFRREIGGFVMALRAAQESLPAVLRHTRALLQSLETAGAITNDGGWFEAEVLEWAIEEFERAA